MTNTSLPPLSLKRGLKIWSKHEGGSATGAHLSALELLRYSALNGMNSAPEERKEHLSNCNVCLQKWFDICEEQGFTDELLEGKSSDDWYTGGMMEAAAGETVSALSLISRCGNFQLNIFPDGEKKGEGMITLEYIGSSDRDLEGKWITVKDIQGLVLLDGVMRVGKLATISQDLQTIDLQAWSVHTRSGEDNGLSE